METAVVVRAVAAALVCLALVACSGDGGSATDTAQNDTSNGDAVTDSPSGVTVTGSLDAKPEITVPDTDPPTELEITDLVVGDGDEAAEGATVTAHYVGKSWSTGEQFDASWDRGQPIPFGLNQVISGWTEGIPGMRVGGRRLLVIPPEQGYGPAGSPPVIGPDETLVFVVDLVDTE
jgi:peptidylprolyl isomerase